MLNIPASHCCSAETDRIQEIKHDGAKGAKPLSPRGTRLDVWLNLSYFFLLEGAKRIISYGITFLDVIFFFFSWRVESRRDLTRLDFSCFFLLEGAKNISVLPYGIIFLDVILFFFLALVYCYVSGWDHTYSACWAASSLLEWVRIARWISLVAIWYRSNNVHVFDRNTSSVRTAPTHPPIHPRFSDKLLGISVGLCGTIFSLGTR